jgi:hypothetical protein
MKLISVIVCSVDPVKFARVSANYAARLAGIHHEIVAIHDAISLAEAYNRGVKRARGEVIVFSHDDIEHLRGDFASELLGSLESADLVGAAGTSLCVDAYWAAAGHPNLHGSCAYPASGGAVNLAVYGIDAPMTQGIQALDGMFFAARREVFDGIAFDEENFDGFHGYDVDFSFRAYKAGIRVAVNNNFLVLHDSGGQFDDTWLRYRERFLRKHFGAQSVPLPARPIFIQSPFRSVDDLVAAWDLPTLVDLTRQLRLRAPPAPRR